MYVVRSTKIPILSYLIVLILLALDFLAIIPVSTAMPSMRTPLAQSNAIITGDPLHGGLGSANSVSGDLDGDGYADIVLGSISGDKVFIFYGRAGGWSNHMSFTDADANLYRDQPNPLGQTLDVVGDVNGDGYDDLVVGQWQWTTPTGQIVGKSYLILGSSTRMSGSLNISKVSAASFIGEKDGDYTGEAVWGGGDVNGDGFDDFCIGSGMNEDHGHHSGKVYLIFGKKDGWAKDVNISVAASASFYGLDDWMVGEADSRNGDFNGDGLTDILIPCLDCDYGVGGINLGYVYIFFGKKDGWKMDVSVLDADASFMGESSPGIGGQTRIVSSVGDVDGNGIDDFVACAFSNDGNGIDAGRAYLVLGVTGGWTKNMSLANQYAYWTGEHPGDRLCTSVGSAGDVDGDGLGDFIIGAETDSDGTGLFRTGQTYLFLGKDWKSWKKDLFANQGATASFTGETGQEDSGIGVGGGGDINGDGLDDFVVGATEGPKGGPGKVYAIFPERNWLPTAVTNLTFYYDPGCTTEIDNASIGQKVYVELKATDTNQSHVDVVRVRVRSNVSDTLGLSILLRETGPGTGIFRGNLTIDQFTNPSHRWIAATNGETVTASYWTGQTSIEDTLMVGPLTYHIILPSSLVANEDTWTILRFNHTGTKPLVLELTGNYHWKNAGYSSANMTLWGLPLNDDVGHLNLTVKLRNSIQVFEQKNITITIVNRPPVIFTADVKTAKVGDHYFVDYNSDDDGQGNVTWHLQTTCPQLQMNSTTGVLSGALTAPGDFDVKLHVDDGNGGKTWRNFTLNVTYNQSLSKIVIRSPTQGSSVGKTFTMNGTAFFPGDTIAYIAYSDNSGAWQAVGPKADWSVVVGPLSPGQHLMKVRAISTKNSWNITANITVTVIDKPPRIQIITPLPGQTVSGIIKISGTASDEDDVLNNGNLYLNGTDNLQFPIINGTWTINVNVSTFPLGDLVIEALVSDPSQQLAKYTVTVTVLNKAPPHLKVQIVSPKAGEKVTSTFNITIIIDYSGDAQLTVEVRINQTIVSSKSISKGTQTVKVTIPAGMKTMTLSVKVSDSKGLTDERSIGILGPTNGGTTPPPHIPKTKTSVEAPYCSLMALIILASVLIAILGWRLRSR